MTKKGQKGKSNLQNTTQKHKDGATQILCLHFQIHAWVLMCFTTIDLVVAVFIPANSEYQFRNAVTRDFVMMESNVSKMLPVLIPV